MCSVYHIWKHRNEVLHGESVLSPELVVRQIINRVKEISCLFKPTIKDTPLETQRLGSIGIQIKNPLTRRGKWINWQPPDRGKPILNFDASRFKETTIIAGIVRDSNGNFIFAHNKKRKSNSITDAEATALLRSLET